MGILIFGTNEEKRLQINFQKISDYMKVKITEEDLYLV